MKRILAAGLTLAIMGAILMIVDRAALWANMRATRPGPFLIAVFLFLPQNMILISRWKFIASKFTPITFANAAGMILAGASMNILLPSKLGDLTKAVFLNRSGAMDLPRATGLVVFEKILDLGSLCLLALVGIGVAFSIARTPEGAGFVWLSLLTAGISCGILGVSSALYLLPESWLSPPRIGARAEKASGLRTGFARGHEVIRLLREQHANLGLLGVLSLSLWILHLTQIYFFFLSLNAPVPLLEFGSLMPLAIFAGLLPLSLFGMGTRDWAVILLFSAHHPPEVLAGVGIYVSLRYVVPAVAGIPFLPRFLGLTKPAKGPSQ